MPFAQLILLSFIVEVETAIVLFATYARLLAATHFALDRVDLETTGNLFTVLLFILTARHIVHLVLPPRLADFFLAVLLVGTVYGGLWEVYQYCTRNPVEEQHGRA